MADSSTPGAKVRSVCVYCGSSETTKPEYLDLATRFGTTLAEQGLRLVYGGGGVGLMGRCAKAASDAGGEVLGIMPRFLEQRERVFDAVPHRMVDTMHERKHIMFEESDAFVVLPGGIGTLEEAVETLSWRRLDLHFKPVVFLAEDDFWDPFFHLIQHTIDANLTPASFHKAVANVRTIEDCLKALAAPVRV
ncbi:MAG: TIGR00730 family Rossman fold protein [Hyphomonadaceae bacterium JAD_PAG50586_4]|nr:MAG: TIGR00730 family Rossman fold protein [Hyphomonadaceae bacterium JAD_PAG50586_4]